MKFCKAKDQFYPIQNNSWLTRVALLNDLFIIIQNIIMFIFIKLRIFQMGEHNSQKAKILRYYIISKFITLRYYKYYSSFCTLIMIYLNKNSPLYL
jgi:hypothetical protein